MLVVDEAAQRNVQPVYVSAGLAWEASERLAVARFLEAVARPRIRALATLGVDMTDVYPAEHWARRGTPPSYHTPDEDVYLPGRNIVLLGKAGVFCAARGIRRLVLGTLDHNPFPDATPVFRSAMQSALALGLAHPLTIDAPYAHLSKGDVIRRGVTLHVPLGLTLSCMNPLARRAAGGQAPDVEGGSGFPLHCGVCSKCRERHEAFVQAGVSDPTVYADPRHTSGGGQERPER